MWIVLIVTKIKGKYKQIKKFIDFSVSWVGFVLVVGWDQVLGEANTKFSFKCEFSDCPA